MKNELEFYDGIKNWDFSTIKYIEENLTDWDLYKILNEILHYQIIKFLI